jgi:hypothetical protein
MPHKIPLSGHYRLPVYAVLVRTCAILNQYSANPLQNHKAVEFQIEEILQPKTAKDEYSRPIARARGVALQA